MQLLTHYQSSRGYAAKDIRFGVDCRANVLAGVDKLADAVQVTLGPKVLLSNRKFCELVLQTGPPKSSHDILRCLADEITVAIHAYLLQLRATKPMHQAWSYFLERSGFPQGL